MWIIVWYRETYIYELNTVYRPAVTNCVHMRTRTTIDYLIIWLLTIWLSALTIDHFSLLDQEQFFILC